MMPLSTISTVFGAIVALWLLRFTISGESIYRYSFIVWNVFLATIPILLESGFRYIQAQTSGTLRRFGQALVAIVWLIFLPNTFYVLTDYMHLNSAVLVNNRDNGNHYANHYSRGDGIYIFDSFLLLCAVVFSAYLGAIALKNAHRYLRRHLPAIYAHLSLALIMLLVSIGVYVGRYGRWNSWDGLIEPWRVLADFIHDVSREPSRMRVVQVVITMMLFQAVSLWCVSRLHGTNRTVIVSSN